MKSGKKAAHFLLHMSGVAGKFCVAAGTDAIGNSGGAEENLKFCRIRFAPDVIDSIFQDMVKFMNFRRSGQDADTHLMEFDVLRQKAESRMITGGRFPDEFVLAVCTQNASSAKNEKTLIWPVRVKPWSPNPFRLKCAGYLFPVVMHRGRTSL